MDSYNEAGSIAEELTDHSSATGQSRPGANVKVVTRCGAHEGELHVGVSVNATCNTNIKINLNIKIKISNSHPHTYTHTNKLGKTTTKNRGVIQLISVQKM